EIHGIRNAERTLSRRDSSPAVSVQRSNGAYLNGVIRFLIAAVITEQNGRAKGFVLQEYMQKTLDGSIGCTDGKQRRIVLGEVAANGVAALFKWNLTREYQLKLNSRLLHVPAHGSKARGPNNPIGCPQIVQDGE